MASQVVSVKVMLPDQCILEVPITSATRVAQLIQDVAPKANELPSACTICSCGAELSGDLRVCAVPPRTLLHLVPKRDQQRTMMQLSSSTLHTADNASTMRSGSSRLQAVKRTNRVLVSVGEGAPVTCDVLPDDPVSCLRSIIIEKNESLSAETLRAMDLRFCGRPIADERRSFRELHIPVPSPLHTCQLTFTDALRGNSTTTALPASNFKSAVGDHSSCSTSKRSNALESSADALNLSSVRRVRDDGDATKASVPVSISRGRPFGRSIRISVEDPEDHFIYEVWAYSERTVASLLKFFGPNAELSLSRWDNPNLSVPSTSAEPQYVIYCDGRRTDINETFGAATRGEDGCVFTLLPP